jgi:hypothetical protein
MALTAEILGIDPVIILRDADPDNIAVRVAAAEVIATARNERNKK